MTYFYFSTQRPVSFGTYPGKFLWFHNFDERKEIPCIGRKAWGVLQYAEPLTDREMDNYELVRANLEWVTCYKDQYCLDFWDRPDKYGDDNLMDILVPVDWLKENCVELTDMDYKTFEEEYTADCTDYLYQIADKEGLIYGITLD